MAAEQLEQYVVEPGRTVTLGSGQSYTREEGDDSAPVYFEAAPSEGGFHVQHGSARPAKSAPPVAPKPAGEAK